MARLDALERNVTTNQGARDIVTFDDVRALAATNAWGRAVRYAGTLVDLIDHGTTTETGTDTPALGGHAGDAEVRALA